MPAASDRAEFAPPPQPGMLRALALAVLAHLLLLIALTFGLRWNRETQDTGAEAELWSAVPQQAAPRAAPPPPAPTPAPAPPPPPPPPAPAPRVAPPPPAPTPAPAPRAADIALEQQKKRQAEIKRREEEQARLERERRQKLEAQRKLDEQKKLEAQRKAEEQKKLLAQQRKAEEQKKLLAERRLEEQKKLEAQRKADEQKKQQLAEARRKDDEKKRRQEKDEQDAKRVAQLREENLRRMQGLAGGSASSSSPNGREGSAPQSSGPSANWAGRIRARVRPNIVFSDDIAGNPTAEVEVRMAPDGTITGRRLVKSSGNHSWDEAVLRAVDKTEVLPRDTDGRIHSPVIIEFRPKG